jgi:2-keto-4-pentenoate hydratase/2-oxohepta-3-ene-1,7-dioic acid hydratase in catechol pathway
VQAGCGCEECWEAPLGILTCGDCLDAARLYAAWFERQDEAMQKGLSLAREDVRLLSPVLKPGKVFCLAGNFPEHVKETAAHKDLEWVAGAQAMTPHVFMKPSTNTICGDGDPIPITRVAQFIDWEAEVVVVIGKRCKYVKAADAASVIAGVTCMNDVSERKLKIWDREKGRDWDRFFDWLNGKWMDNFAPMGPCVVPVEDVDLDNLMVRCFVNGKLEQEGNTGDMYHSAALTVEYISQFLTLEPGDVIALGTPSGVGLVKDVNLKPGDVVSVEVEGVGTLTNPVEAEQEA